MAPTAMSASALQATLDKMRSPDADYRCMALIDLTKDLSSGARSLEDLAESSLITEILKMVDDSNGEVKNMAVSTLTVIVSRVKRHQQINVIINQMLKNAASAEEEQRDIASMALKSILNELPLSSSVVPEVVTNVSNSVLKLVQSPDVNTQHAVELIDILSLIFTRYPAQIVLRHQIQLSALQVLLSLLSSPRPHIRKRAIHALSTLGPLLNDSNFAVLSKDILATLGSSDAMDVDGGSGGSTDLVKKTSYASLVGALAKSCAPKIAKSLDGLMPCLLSLTEELESEDALEASMTTLETLVLRCPTEVTPFLRQITERCTLLLKYDPNYAGSDDEDEEENGMDEDEAEEDDEYEEEDDEYSDEEDSSWKARRSAAKLIHALISTRPESLQIWYKSFAPLLTSRLSEREESVRMEVFADWEALLQQTALATGSLAAPEEAPAGLKRKRTESGESSVDAMTSQLNPLLVELPTLIKAALKQALAKSPATKERGFALLKAIVDIRGGGLENQADSVATAVQKAFAATGNAQTGGAASASLLSTVLSFLGTYFEHQPARAYAETLSIFVPLIVKSMSDKLQRISTQAFTTASRLARGLRPQATSGTVSPLKGNYSASVEEIYTATASTVQGNSADAEVRNKALLTLGDLLVHEADILQPRLQECLDIVSKRLEFEVTQASALLVIGMASESALCRGSVFDGWLLRVLDTMPTLLRRSHSDARNSVLACLKKALARVGTSLPLKTASSLLSELKTCITRDKKDVPVLPSALDAVAQIFVLQPATRQMLEKEVLPLVLDLVAASETPASIAGDSTPEPQSQTASLSPLAHGAALEALLHFFSTYTEATDKDAGIRLVAQLFSKVPTNTKMGPANSPTVQAYAAVAKSVGIIMSKNAQIFSYFAAEFRQPFEKRNAFEGQIYLTLLTVGEAGREIDQSAQPKDWEKLFQLVSKLLEHQVEQIKSAAAFSLGNIAVGNTAVFLPQIVEGVSHPKTPAVGLLYLHALKETIEHCTAAQIESIAETLWTPLLGKETEEQDEGARNVRAACIGKLSTAKPTTYLPELHSRIKSDNPNTRAIIAAAIRYTLVDTSATYDELLSSLILDFLLLMEDPDYNVRRLAVTSLNAAAQNKPELVQMHLPALLPALYKETEKKPELLRKYQMGPWAVVQDDGTNNRKAAFEAMLTLLKTCLNQIDRNQLLDRVMEGLQDEDEVKVLCCVLLQRLLEVAPASLMQRLDDLAERVKPIMDPLVETKDTNAQDRQRKEELQKAAIRAIFPIYQASMSIGSNKFNDMLAQNQSKWKDYAA